MINIGEYQLLTIRREMPQGLYLEDSEGNEVLMPRRYVTDDMLLEDMIEVFVYCDSEDRDIATTEEPKMIVGQFAYLEVTDVNTVGAFCDWGVSKELFVPFANQSYKLERGDHAVVYMFADTASDRLVGTTKINKYLQFEQDEFISKGMEVNILVHAETDLGYNVVINQRYGGLIYKNELPNHLRIGETRKAYIKPLREDGKIDVSIFPVGHESIEPNAEMILSKIEANNGMLPFTDKSSPDEILKEFGISKKLFKKAVGALYKQKTITLKEDGIYKNSPELDLK